MVCPFSSNRTRLARQNFPHFLWLSLTEKHHLQFSLLEFCRKRTSDEWAGDYI